MSDLVEFLTARLDEDEQRAPGVSAKFMTVTREVIGVIDPARVLAEVEAKRRIIALWSGYEEVATGPVSNWREGFIADVSRTAIWDSLRYLTIPYADHPDYRQEWKL